MKNVDLIKYAKKNPGDELPAATWNALMQDLMSLNNPNFKTFKVEQYTRDGDNESWEDITETFLSSPGLTAGNIYRISGYYEGELEFTGSNPDTKSKLILDGCIIKSESGKCIYYNVDKKNLEVIINPGTENYLIQTSDSEDYRKKAAILSENNLVITGAGILYLNNAVGHGIKSSKLELRGANSIIVDAAHDAFHATQLLDIYNGDYYVLGCNDSFGSGVRADDHSEDTKLRGIIRVFGGNFHIYGMGSNAKVFDAKYAKMVYGTPNGGSSAYYSDETGNEVPVSDFTEILTYHSGFHTLLYTLDGPAVTDSNISDNFSPYTELIPQPTMEGESFTFDGTVKKRTKPAAGATPGEFTLVDPTTDSQGNKIYTISDNAQEILVEGCVKGTIICSGKPEDVILNKATIIAPTTGDNAFIAIKYTNSKQNVQIKTENDSEGNFILGQIVSTNNIKLSPKSGSILQVIGYNGTSTDDNPTVGIDGSTIMYCDGGGSIYVSNFGVGIKGSEQWIGNENEDAISDRDTENDFDGDIYAYNNTKYDAVARINSDLNNKGFFHLMINFEGNAFFGNIKSMFAPLQTFTGKTRKTGNIIGESIVAGRLFYQKCDGSTIVTKGCAVSYNKVNSEEFINRFK